MSATTQPEVWLRGPLPNVSPYLQPAAHALLQAKDEVSNFMQDFPDALLWNKPAGLASVGFHLQHLTGVLDRLFTYAKGTQLSAAQLTALQKEGKVAPTLTTAHLVNAFQQQVETALQQIKDTDESTLTDFRGVGRAQLPSTVLGLMVHAAEHTMRHTGQLLVTVQVVKAQLL